MAVVSIIVPVYNVEKYIFRCIDSILAQTFKNFELILVDDGSTDSCGDICDKYAKQDNRISVIHQNNSGVSVARNVGLEASHGEYVTFVDSDDWISEYYLEKLVMLMSKYNADIVMCNYLSTDNDICDCIYSDNDEVVMSGFEALNKFGLNMDFRGPICKLIRKTIVQKFQFPAGRVFSEDFACVYLWIAEADVFVCVDDKLYIYFQNTESVVHKGFNEYRLQVFITYNEMMSFYKKNNFELLYYLTLAYALHDAMRYYEICKKLNDTMLSLELKSILNSLFSDIMNITLDKAIEQREDIIIILRRYPNRFLYESYVIKCVNFFALFEDRIQFNVKSRLKKILITCRPSITKCPIAYQFAFPKLTSFFWKIIAQKDKLRRKMQHADS